MTASRAPEHGQGRGKQRGDSGGEGTGAAPSPARTGSGDTGCEASLQLGVKPWGRRPKSWDGATRAPRGSEGSVLAGNPLGLPFFCRPRGSRWVLETPVLPAPRLPTTGDGDGAQPRPCLNPSQPAPCPPNLPSVPPAPSSSSVRCRDGHGKGWMRPQQLGTPPNTAGMRPPHGTTELSHRSQHPCTAPRCRGAEVGDAGGCPWPPPDPLPLTSRLYLATTLPMELVAVQT